MMLHDGAIYDLAHGLKMIEPFNIRQLQPASYDVLLGSTLKRFVRTADTEYAPLSIDGETMTMVGCDLETVDSEAYILHHGEFVLGSTIETVTIPNDVGCRFEGKSSLGRIGLQTHITAGFVDPGFHGQITLEIHNCGPFPIVLHDGMAIGQLCFYDLDAPSTRPYGDAKLRSHYQNQHGPTESSAAMR